MAIKNPEKIKLLKIMKNTSLLVTVIMPVHNRFNLVDESIASVYEQTHRPIELIVVDDLSDGSYIPKIASSGDFEVKIIRHEKNLGPGEARETGRMAAKGDYIAYLDSDDLWGAENLEKQLEVLKAHPEAGMCYCKTVEFKVSGKFDADNLRNRNDQSFDTILPTLFWGRPWSTSSCVWTRKAVDLIGPWYSGWMWEDREYDFRAGIKQVKICHAPEILCYKREDSSPLQLSNLPRKKYIDQQYNAIQEIYKTILLHKKNLDNQTRSLFVHRIFRHFLKQLINNGEFGKVKELCSYMVKVSPPLSRIWGISLILLVLSNLINIPGIRSIFLRVC